MKYLVFPGWHYAFPVRTRWRRRGFGLSIHQGLIGSKLDRAPVPYLKMRYDNTKTKGGGVGPARGFTKPGVLLFELGLLEVPQAVS